MTPTCEFTTNLLRRKRSETFNAGAIIDGFLQRHRISETIDEATEEEHETDL